MAKTTAIIMPPNLGLTRRENTVWMIDEERNKWLTIDRISLSASRRKTRDAYLWTSGSFALSKTGYTMREVSNDGALGNYLGWLL